MRDAIAALLELLDRRAVNVKASTGNLSGEEGAGRGISAAAVAIAGAAPVTVRLHDTLSGETRPLEPLEPGHVRIYSCGPTVYGPAHIGNFRTFLFADLLVRYLRYRGLRVTWVMNITDIDDKIIRGAAAAGIGIDELADRWLAAVPRRRASAADDAARRPAARDRAHRRDGRRSSRRSSRRATPTGPTTARSSSGSPRGRPTAGSPGSTRSRCGSASASRPTSTRKDDVRDFALWKGAEAGRAVVGDGDRAGPARLAHRVLGDGDEAPRPVVRHPHRRRRPDLPAPRGRDRPERGGDREAVRPDLAPLRAPPDERREDGQVDRQHRPGRRAARVGRSTRGRCATR